MRVLLVGTGIYPIPPTGYGGVERTIAELARALRAEGAEVALLHEVRSQRPIDEYRFALRLGRGLRAIPHDVVHAHTPVVGNRLRWSGVPFVYTTHSRHWFYRRRWGDRWGYFLERRAVAGAQVAIALTEPLRSEIRRVLGPRSPSAFPVVPIGVDLERFRPGGGAREGDRALGVGVIERFKRWEIAARALAGTGYRLTLVGPISDRVYASELRALGPNVTLAGELPDDALVAEYARSDLFVHPSAVELLPGVVLQALASGLPVLGGAPVQGLVEEGRTGFVTPASAGPEEMVARFRTAALGLREDPARRQSMGRAARASAETRFAWSAVARAHLAAYAQALAR